MDPAAKEAKTESTEKCTESTTDSLRDDEEEEEDEAKSEPTCLPKFLQSLRHPNYRLLWIGNLISQSGDWMDQVAFSWLIYTMTKSTVWLAMINVCRAGPIIIFTLIGGVVADRMERRKLLFTTQFIMMVLAFLLSGLLTAGLLQVWMAFAIAVGRGITASFNQPARQSLISELVPPADLPNAIALNSATLNLTKVIGPAAGGIMISLIGVAGAFYANAVSYVAVLASLYFMELPPRAMAAHEAGILTDLKEGISYIRREKALLTLVFLALMPMVFGQPYQTMLTVYAKDVFKAGSTGLGVMQSVAALGAVSGALIMATASKSHYFVHKMLLGLIGLGAAILAFSVSPNFWFAIPALIAAGLCQQTYQTSNNTMLQLKVDPEYRARVLSMLFLQRGLVPLGTMMIGYATTLVGPRWATGGMAVVLLILSGITYPIALPLLSKLMPRKGKRAKAALDEEEGHAHDVEMESVSANAPLINNGEDTHAPAAVPGELPAAATDPATAAIAIAIAHTEEVPTISASTGVAPSGVIETISDAKLAAVEDAASPAPVARTDEPPQPQGNISVATVSTQAPPPAAVHFSPSFPPLPMAPQLPLAPPTVSPAAAVANSSPAELASSALHSTTQSTQINPHPLDDQESAVAVPPVPKEDS